MSTAIKHPVSDWVKLSFVIFDIWTLWRSALTYKLLRGCWLIRHVAVDSISYSVNHYRHMQPFKIDNSDMASAPATTGSSQAATSDIHQQLPTNMADIRRDWLTKPKHGLVLCWYLAETTEYLLTAVASTVSRRIYIFIHACDAFTAQNDGISASK